MAIVTFDIQNPASFMTKCNTSSYSSRYQITQHLTYLHTIHNLGFNCLKLLVISVIAVSTGSLSIELAP